MTDCENMEKDVFRRLLLKAFVDYLHNYMQQGPLFLRSERPGRDTQVPSSLCPQASARTYCICDVTKRYH